MRPFSFDDSYYTIKTETIRHLGCPAVVTVIVRGMLKHSYVRRDHSEGLGDAEVAKEVYFIEIITSKKI